MSGLIECCYPASCAAEEALVRPQMQNSERVL